MNSAISRTRLPSCTLSYRFIDRGPLTVVIETGLGSCFHEWLPVAGAFPETCSVLLYDRAGYGRSSESSLARTPSNVAAELNALISAVCPGRRYILVGHSLGGLYAQQYARLYPGGVVAVIFLDPMTTSSHRFKEALSPDEYQGSGIDKSAILRHTALLGSFGLLPLLKPSFRKGTPFLYRNDYNRDAIKEILHHCTRNKTYKTALDEHYQAQQRDAVVRNLGSRPFPEIPVSILYHNPDAMIREIMASGGLPRLSAEKIEMIWNSVVREEYLRLSPHREFLVTPKSGHYIHLTDTGLLVQSLNRHVRQADRKN
jgi:pimeloyl-ACP methyl ester carboxylesterase